jgi:hypothetical protein
MVGRTQPTPSKLLVSFIRGGKIERRFVEGGDDALRAALSILSELSELQLGDCLLVIEPPEELPAVSTSSQHGT